MKCEECRYWERIKKWDNSPRELEYGECGITHADYHGLPEILPISYIRTVPTDDADAFLMTKPDFGCVLFESKQQSVADSLAT